MNKFKKILLGALSVLTLGLFVVTGTKVTAASTVAYSASAQATKTDKNIAAHDIVSIENVLTVHANKSNKIEEYQWSYSDDNKTFTKIHTPSGATSSGNGYTFTAAKAMTITVYYTVSNGSDYKTGAVTTGNAALSNSVALTSNTAPSATSNAGKLVFDLSANGSTELTSSDNRLFIFEIDYEVKASTDGTFDVTYVTGGGTLESGYSNPTNLSAAAEITLPSCTKEGYTFVNWTCSKDSNTYEAGAKYNASTEVTFTANWTGNKYTVTYDANGGSIENATKEVTYGSSYTLDTPVRDGYAFTGWKNGNTAVSSTGTWAIADNVTLTANWIAAIDTEYSHNFTTSGKTDAKMSISGNLATDKGTATYNNLSLTQCLKMESSTSVSFATSKDMTLVLVFASDDNGKKTKIDGTSYTADSSAQIVMELEAGSHTITKDGTAYLFYIDLYEDNMAHGVTAATAAFQNTDKDSLRFVGTISGVSDLSTIDTIELVLLKNDEPTKKQIFLTTCFISVSGAGSFEEIDDTYYVVYRITGIDSTSMPDNTVIKHKLIVTFTDGSSVTSLVESSKWTN